MRTLVFRFETIVYRCGHVQLGFVGFSICRNAGSYGNSDDDMSFGRRRRPTARTGRARALSESLTSRRAAETASRKMVPCWTTSSRIMTAAHYI